MIFDENIDKLIAEDINLRYEENEQKTLYDSNRDILISLLDKIDFNYTAANNKIMGSYCKKIFDNDIIIKYSFDEIDTYKDIFAASNKTNYFTKLSRNNLYINEYLINGEIDEYVIEHILYCIGLFYEKVKWIKNNDTKINRLKRIIGSSFECYFSDEHIGGLYYAYKYKTTGVINYLYNIEKYINLNTFIDFKDINNIYKVIKDTDLYHNLRFIKHDLLTINKDDGAYAILDEAYNYIIKILHIFIMHIFERYMPFKIEYNIKINDRS